MIMIVMLIIVITLVPSRARASASCSRVSRASRPRIPQFPAATTNLEGGYYDMIWYSMICCCVMSSYSAVSNSIACYIICATL